MMAILPNHLLYNLYCDGGVIGKNPSAYGGVWAWCLVSQQGKRVSCDSGVVEPKAFSLPTITNNCTELLAAVKGLESMLPGWAGLLYTDSKITYYRLTTSNKFNQIPAELRDRCLRLRWAKAWTVLHCGGHPRKMDLEVGYDKRGLQVSAHNVWCDKQCKAEAKRFVSDRRLKGTALTLGNR